MATAYRKVCRIRNYQAAFNIYVYGVQTLDEEMAGKMKTVIAEYNPNTALLWDNIIQNMLNGADEYKNDYEVVNVSTTSDPAAKPSSEENSRISRIEQMDAAEAEQEQLEQQKVLKNVIKEAANFAKNVSMTVINGELSEEQIKVQLNNYWNRTDGYFSGKWCQDREKMEQVAVLLQDDIEKMAALCSVPVKFRKMK